MQFTYEREFTYNRAYRGPIKLVVLDWAGTTMDFGCMAPAVVFCKVFEEEGVPISMEEARIPMGAHKKVHIGLITEIPGVRARWTKAKGSEPTEDDVIRMFERFVPLQEACLSEYSELIPGTLDAIKACRDRGYKIGSTSGYLPGMLAINLADAQKQGYDPDATFGAGDVPRGRPFGHMVLRNILELDISCVQSVVKIDDTLTGIEEGLNAGGWAIGLAISGNEVGVQHDEWMSFSEEVKQKHRDRIYPTMYQRGAHYVIDSIADLMPCLDDIEARLRRGEKP
ncbi:MAG: phosphonoacetaldehyde hydrolase [Gammaproteobacteria bacterium]|nr:MAG: phosphonoacetaldehyde hydrolase [Gammaproteobacteria bacterium]